MKPIKEIVQSPKFAFGLVWVLTISLFVAGWSKFAFDIRNRARQIKSETGLVSIQLDELKTRLKTSKSNLILVHLWATWCPPCERELPIYAEMQKKFASKNVEFIVISGDAKTDMEKAQNFLASKQITFRTYLMDGDPDSFMKAMSPAWSGALPATFLFKPGGALSQMILGESNAKTLETKIENALASAVAAPEKAR